MPNTPPIRRRPAAVALILLFAAALPAASLHAQEAAQQSRKTYAIAAGPLEDALTRFAASAGIALSFDPALVAGLRSPGLNGSHTGTEGLRRLLQGSGLEPVERGDGGYTLRKLPPAPAGEATLAPVTVRASGLSDATTEGTGSYTTGATGSATRLPLSLRETPQSVSIITRQQMDDQGLQNISGVLQQTPGITVNRDNTEGYSFFSRGFQLENFHFDGIPSLSSAGGNVRDNYSITDSAIYDRVEILKGATGLANGAGYPSGVVNMVRKRPTVTYQGHASIGAGSWDNYRAEVDLSGPLATDGRIRGRIVAAAQDNRSFIDHLKNRQELLYGIAEADLAPSTTLSLGFDIQRNRNDATSNSHLPAFYSDGSVARFSRSTNAADVWAYRNHDTQRFFATLEHGFGNDWHLKAHVGQRKYESREIISGMSSATIDPVTHSITHGFYAGGASHFNTDTREDNLDLQLSGNYSLFGRKHQIVLGYGTARTQAISNRWDGDTDASITDVFNWDNNATRPAFYEWWSTFDIDARQKIGYASTIFKATDRLSLILGARTTDYSWRLDSINALGTFSRTATKVSGEVTPYAGLTFDIDRRHTVYASYTDVFKPQAYSYDANDRQLDPLTGESFEIGAKGSYFGGKLNASAAVFEIRQDNFAQRDPSGAIRPNGGVAYVAIQGVETRGFELEVAGEISAGWQINAGLVHAESRDANGDRVSTTQPENSFKLATNYRLPGRLNHVALGGSIQWQSGTYFTQTIAGQPRRFEQPAYGIVGLIAGVDLAKNLKTTVGINNLFDKKYYAGIGNYNTVYWGTPRNIALTMQYRF